MARKKTPDGRRVHVNVKLSEGEAELIDAVRGDLERGPWIREVALPVAARMRDSGIREPVAPLSIGGIEVGVLVDPRQPPGTVFLVSAGTDRDGKLTADAAHMVNAGGDEPGAKLSRCEHRVPSGSYCTRCGRLI